MRDKVFTKDNPVKLAENWIMNSGIQNIEGEEKGGFNAWFNLDSRDYSYVYSEITGYGITTLLYLSKFFEGSYKERAILAWDWIREKALHSSGAVMTRLYLDDTEETDQYSFLSENLYAFDNGMVLYALVNLYKETNDEDVIKCSIGIADFLIEKMRKDNGLFYASCNPSTGKKVDSDWKWSSQSGSYHAKLALGFIDLFDLTKDYRYKEAAIGVLEKAVGFQDKDSGRFVTSRLDMTTHLHPHSYSAEGLLYGGFYFNREDFIASAVKAVKWALDNMRADGGICKKYDKNRFIKLYRADVLAQILRLGSVMLKENVLDKEYLASLKKLRSKLLTFQYNLETNQKGGFYYGYTLDGEKKNHLNSWCTMFALQALLMFERDDADLSFFI